MLHILWIFLKIVGMLLLIILGLFVITVCAVAFVPVRYHADATINEKLDSLKLHAKFSWLFSLISGRIVYEEERLVWQVRIAWKKLHAEKKETTEELIDDASRSEKDRDYNRDKTSNPTDESAENIEENIIDDIADDKESVKSEKKKKYTFQKICDKIKVFIEKKEDFRQFVTDEVHCAAWKRLLRETVWLLKVIRPRRLKINLKFGFEDPATTGKVLGVLSMLYPFYADNVNLEPDFENQILEGDLFLKGYIMCMHLLIVLWNLFFDKNVKQTYKDIQNGKDKK